MAKTGWRDTVSDTVENDFDELFGAAVDFAMQQLRGDIPIMAFALERRFDGETSVVATAPDSDVTGESLPSLYGNEETRDLRTLAFAFEIHNSGAARELAVWLESREASIQIIQQFEKTSDDSVDLLGVRAGQNRPRVQWGQR